jgi:hypothetical protein
MKILHTVHIISPKDAPRPKKDELYELKPNGFTREFDIARMDDVYGRKTSIFVTSNEPTEIGMEVLNIHSGNVFKASQIWDHPLIKKLILGPDQISDDVFPRVVRGEIKDGDEVQIIPDENQDAYKAGGGPIEYLPHDLIVINRDNLFTKDELILSIIEFVNSDYFNQVMWDKCYTDDDKISQVNNWFNNKNK